VLILGLGVLHGPGHLGRHGRPRRAEGRLAAGAARPCPLLPQRRGHARLPGANGHDRRLRPELHGRLCQERGLPRVVDAAGTGPWPWAGRTSRCWPTSSTSWGRRRWCPGSWPGRDGLGLDGRAPGRSSVLLFLSTSGPISRSLTRRSACCLLPGHPDGPGGDGGAGAGTWRGRPGMGGCRGAGLGRGGPVPLTAAMVVAPGGGGGVCGRGGLGPPGGTGLSRRPARRGLGHPPVVLGVQLPFWWLPGSGWPAPRAKAASRSRIPSRSGAACCRSSAGAADPGDPLGLGAWGLVVLARRDRVAAAGLAGFIAAGFFWGYLAGASRALDFLQPGRHTYAFYSGATVAAGVGLPGRSAGCGRGVVWRAAAAAWGWPGRGRAVPAGAWSCRVAPCWPGRCRSCRAGRRRT
jgi:hypothetical protein